MKLLQTNPIAYIILSICLIVNTGVCEDLQIEELKKKAEAGDAVAMNSLGELYLSGEEAETNIREALSQFRQAANLGNGKAQFNLGFMYTRGIGVELNLEDGIKWLEKASDSGIVEAQVDLGLLFVNEEESSSGDVLV